ncbi:Fe-Mn family superoxide dismutase [Frigoribacterium sp. PvP120]|jgi:Fe-Mn family superoxide dismutase|uniref:superoxide dismutase n=1 Tax=unclassified Frigoribacterium TaxID=2627005 RepID=UPI0006FD26AF|nr:MULTISPECIES: superoxide dismutase [unclassified Frigoribacterium]KQR44566.1 superoxide dismutase [Frigoribacterium sp. Leaf164]MBD8660798.1 superoxide dismutase [Frigoribacterium sp. CFBP 8754]MBD8728215.1 superoxide dismutase [Frigoribacterium sp. CFBP 13707]MBP1240375.1 Fe-Mn family superoxide dismutase [Frigoribacterium sp. PvP121]QNE44002.1 superoxide dismutase [Frigoribacterium sp. NBH87]
MAEYTLPDLPYDYSALAPHISAQIMELHHSKHHNTYVTGANTANAALAEARDKGDLANVNKLEKDLAFNLGGHVNHSIFWTNLTPETSEPVGDLLEAIGRDFGDLEKFKAHFTATALGVQGSGWSVLAYDVIGQRLSVFQLFDQQGNVPFGLVPLLMLDVWEHAYYLDYQNVRADYVKAFWNIVNWENVAQRYAAATTKTQGLLTF